MIARTSTVCHFFLVYADGLDDCRNAGTCCTSADDVGVYPSRIDRLTSQPLRLTTLNGCSGAPPESQVGITKASQWDSCKADSIVRVEPVIGWPHLVRAWTGFLATRAECSNSALGFLWPDWEVTFTRFRGHAETSRTKSYPHSFPNRRVANEKQQILASKLYEEPVGSAAA